MSNPFGFQTLEEMAAALKTILRGDGCRVYSSVPISHATSGTTQFLLFNSERFDIGNMHSVVSNTSRITITEPGIYIVFATVEFAVNAIGQRGLNLRVNGSVFITGDLRNAVGGGIATQMSVITGYQFSAGDYVEVGAYQNSGGALQINSSAQYTPEFGAVRIL